MRAKTVVAIVVVLLAALVPVASAAEDASILSAEDIFGPDDQVFTIDFPPGPYGLGSPQVAGYSDPLGLIDNYEFTSLYTQGVDRIAVYSCSDPRYGDSRTTAAQAVAIGNATVRDHFSALSEGVYSAEYVLGGDIPASSIDPVNPDPKNGRFASCSRYASYPGNYPPGVNGVIFVENIRGGVGGPGYGCVFNPYSTCVSTWPENQRSAAITSGSLIAMVWTHEQGHMVTWPHSGSGAPKSNDYDNPIGLMSGNLSVYGGAVPYPYETNVANRLAAGWIKPGRTLVYGGGVVEIDLTTAGTAGTQMIAITDGPDAFWSIGARISDANDPFPSEWNGVEVMYIANCGQTCYPLERKHITAGQTPWKSGSGRPVHILPIGGSETISGAGYDIAIEVLSGDGDSFQIRLSDPNNIALPDDVKRLSGPDRYATSGVVSAEVFTDPSAVSTVFVATGANFPDALGAAAAAGYLGAPVLLVGNSVSGAVATELTRLKPDTIYVVGGTSVVSDAVASQLGLYGTVKRLSGANRYATSAAVSAEVFPDPSAVSTVFVATGANFPDALGAAAAAGYLGAPVLLVGDSVPGPVAAELTRLKPDRIYVVGGTSVVSDVVKAQLGVFGSVERIAGNDRYGTSAQLSSKIFTDPSAVSMVFVATGANFPDALGAAAAAGYLGSPVLLVSDITVPGSVASELARLNPAIKYVVGGPAVIPNIVAAQL